MTLPILIIILILYIALENVLAITHTRREMKRQGDNTRFLRVGNGLVAMPNVGSCRTQHHPADSSYRFRQNTALF